MEKLQDGTIPLFAGVSEVLRNDIIVAVKLRDFNAGLPALLGELGRLEAGDFSFFMAWRDFPLHATIQVAVGGHEAKDELKSRDGYININGNLLTFDRLVLDAGGNIMFMNEGVPREVSEWRGWASQVMIEYGGVPKPLPVFHSTVARIQRFEYSIAAAMKLTALVRDWNAVLQRRPMEFVSGGTFVGTTYDLLTT